MTLSDPNTTDEQKRSADKRLNRIKKMELRRTAALAEVGEKPRREDFESDAAFGDAIREYRAALDRHVIIRETSAVLDDPASSSRVRQNARERLAAIGIVEEEVRPIAAASRDERTKSKRSSKGPCREDLGFRSGEDWDEFLADGREAKYQAALEHWHLTAPPLSPGEQQFLDDLQLMIDKGKEKNQ